MPPLPGIIFGKCLGQQPYNNINNCIWNTCSQKLPVYNFRNSVDRHSHSFIQPCKNNIQNKIQCNNQKIAFWIIWTAYPWCIVQKTRHIIKGTVIIIASRVRTILTNISCLNFVTTNPPTYFLLFAKKCKKINPLTTSQITVVNRFILYSLFFFILSYFIVKRYNLHNMPDLCRILHGSRFLSLYAFYQNDVFLSPLNIGFFYTSPIASADINNLAIF